MAIQEFEATATFFATILKRTKTVDESKINAFVQILTDTLENCYLKQWHPDQPLRGSGNRCIRMSPCRIDPLVSEVGELAGISNLKALLPSELILWVDPNCVCYRVNERSPIFTIYGDKEEAASPKISPQSSPKARPAATIKHHNGVMLTLPASVEVCS